MTKRETEKQSELEREKWRERERKLDEINGNKKKKNTKENYENC